MATAATAIAGTVAIGAYLNGKYHIAKDLKSLYEARQSRLNIERARIEGRMNILDAIRRHSRQIAQELSIWTPSRSYTWSETFEYTMRYAHWFLSKGVGRGDIVAFYLQNSAEFIFAWLALSAINAAPAMLNYNLTGRALVHCIKVAECKMLLIDEELQDRVFGNQEVIEVGIETFVLSESLKKEIEHMEAKELDETITSGTTENSPLALRYTSGTTGFPKAVRTPISRTYGFVYGKFAEFKARPQPNGDRWYIAMPMCHATAGSVTMANLIMGVSLCVSKKFSIKNFWPEIRESKSTLFVYVGEICRYLLTLPPSPQDKDHNIRLMYGNGLRPDVWKAFRERFGVPAIAELFGSTEGVIAFVNIAKGDFLANAIGHHGFLLRRWHHHTYVPVESSHETGELVRDPVTGFARRNPYDVGGEILVAVPSTASFLGYYKNPESTEKRFVRDVFKKGDLYYRSGDALRRNNDGKWFFMDRLGDTFRWKSENVSTAEVSETLGNFPAIIDANVVGVAVPGHEGRAGCAALLLKEPELDLEALLRHARRDLPKYAVPVFLRIVDEPAMNNTHKQSKTALREEGVDPAKTRGDRIYILTGDKYVEFTKEQWNWLGEGKMKL